MVGTEETFDGRYRRVMHGLLRRDYLTALDRDAALRDLALMIRQATQAQEALVATHASESGWSATSSRGQRLSDRQISRHGSRSVLEEVRVSGEPILHAGQEPFEMDSHSVREHGLISVIAVPFHRWDTSADPPRRTFAGCIYAHRTFRAGAFSEHDVELVSDITEVAQRTLNVLDRLIEVTSELDRSRDQLRALQAVTSSELGLGDSISRDPDFIARVVAPLLRVSRARRIGLLLIGPTGSGKTYLTQAYHRECPRKDGPFVVLDCAQITSEQTMAAELFGFAPRSGFANAPEEGRAGAAELADGGTLFVDEVTAIPPGLQQRLLALIETGTFTPLGSSEKRQVDIQVIAAANEDPRELVSQGRFREDLLWRLSELVVELPSLSERVADIEPLAQRFLKRARERFERPEITGFTREAIHRLVRHDWARSGNIRGLEHTVHRSLLLADPSATELGADDIELGGSGPPSSRAERAAADGEGEAGGLLVSKIREHRGNLSAMAADPEVAAELGYPQGRIPVSSLRLRLRKLGFEEKLRHARRKQRARTGRDAPDLDRIRAAIIEHGSGTEAARALGINRDVLVWHLRKAGLSVRRVLAERDER